MIFRLAKSFLSKFGAGLAFLGLRNAVEIHEKELPAFTLAFSLLVNKIALLRTSCHAFLEAVSGNLKINITSCQIHSQQDQYENNYLM